MANYCCTCQATFQHAVRDVYRQPSCPFCNSRSIVGAKPVPFVHYDPIGPPPGRPRLGGNRSAAKLIPKLVKRDGVACHLCGLPIDITLPYGPKCKHPRRATLDHLLPRSAGGTNAMRNLALAHADCNLERGATPLSAEQLLRRGVG